MPRGTSELIFPTHLSPSSPFPEWILTDTLLLVQASDGVMDVRSLYDYCSSETPHVVDALDDARWLPHTSLSDTKEHMETAAEQWETGSRATYFIFERENLEPPIDDGVAPQGSFVGEAMLDADWERRAGRLGMWTTGPTPDEQVVAERVHALSEIAFSVLDFRIVELQSPKPDSDAVTAIDNAVGLFDGQRDGELRLHRPRLSCTSVRWSITAEEYYGSPTETDISRFNSQ